MERIVANFPGPPLAGLSQVAVADGWVTVSGQLALRDGVIVGKADPARQARQCFENIRAALALVGSQLSEVVKLTCYLTDRTAYPPYAALKADLFPSQPPAGTAIIVAGLLLPDALLEVEALAFRSSRACGGEGAERKFGKHIDS